MASGLTLPWLGRTLDLMPGWKVVRFTMPTLAGACVLVAIAPNVVVLTLALYLLRLFGQGMMYLFMPLLGISSSFTSTLLGALWPEVYGLGNLGGIRAIIVSAIVLSTALGPGLSGELIDRGISLPTQMLWLSGWCVAACFVLAFAARRVRLREARALVRKAL